MKKPITGQKNHKELKNNQTKMTKVIFMMYLVSLCCCQLFLAGPHQLSFSTKTQPLVPWLPEHMVHFSLGAPE